MKHLRPALEELRAADLLREPPLVGAPFDGRVMIQGVPFINFASNNYLGLATHPRVKQAAIDAIQRWGTGATGSRLLSGTSEAHVRLEEALAAFKRTEAAVTFPSGYQANIGMIPALAGPDDIVFLDRLAHASLVDGARMARAALRVFAHNDMDDLEKCLKRYTTKGQRWIVTESVFSMDGDRAPLKDLVALAQTRGAHTYVDEAHGTGVWGPEGRGWINAQGVERQVDVCMGTLSKALGGTGGFICGSRELIAWAHNRCRSFIYSTALPPACAAAAVAALDVVREEPERREKLFRLSARLRRGLNLPGEGPIVPLIVGGEKETLALAQHLRAGGVFAPAIRPPTVPKGTARLRFSLTADHTENDVDRVLEILEKSLRKAIAQKAS